MHVKQIVVLFRKYDFNHNRTKHLLVKSPVKILFALIIKFHKNQTKINFTEAIKRTIPNRYLRTGTLKR